MFALSWVTGYTCLDSFRYFLLRRSQQSTFGLATAYVGLYNSHPNGIGLIPPVTPEGRRKYAGNTIVIISGSSSVGQNGKSLRCRLSERNLPLTSTTQPFNLRNFLASRPSSPLHRISQARRVSQGATHVINRNISASALVSEVASITENVPLKYAADSISLADTQQAAYDLLAPGGRLATFLPVAVKITEEKHVIHAIGVISYPSNVELLNTLFHNNFEGLLKEGAIKVSNVLCSLFRLLMTNWIILAKPGWSITERTCWNPWWIETIGIKPSIAIEAGRSSTRNGIIIKEPLYCTCFLQFRLHCI